MANSRKTKTPRVYVAHQRRCPAFENDNARYRCEPSWRGHRHNRLTGKAECQKPVTKDRSEALSWLGIGKRASHARERTNASRTFESIGDEWLDGVKAGRISRRRAAAAVQRHDHGRLHARVSELPATGVRPDARRRHRRARMADVGVRLSREGLQRSRISTMVAVASAIYAWAITPTRRYATRNPLRLIELPPNDERPRLRVAFASEAE